MLIGFANDWLRPRLGIEVIRYSMATAASTTLIGGIIFCVAAQFLERDMARTVAD